MSLPIIANATVSPRRVDVIADAGYVLYDLNDYTNFNPAPEDICYSRAIYNLPVTYDFTKIIVVLESEVPADQIYGTGNNQETI